MNRKDFESNLTNNVDMWTRFLKKIEFTDSCWNYTGAIHKHTGYGTFSPKTKFQIGAHRASYLFHYGEIHTGNNVLHRCHNRVCVNPFHLRQGTQLENMRDQRLSGRDKYNEDVVSCKVSKKQVLEIRQLAVDKVAYPEISKRYGISKSLVCMIVKNKRRLY